MKYLMISLILVFGTITQIAYSSNSINEEWMEDLTKKIDGVNDRQINLSEEILEFQHDADIRHDKVLEFQHDADIRHDEIFNNTELNRSTSQYQFEKTKNLALTLFVFSIIIQSVAIIVFMVLDKLKNGKIIFYTTTALKEKTEFAMTSFDKFLETIQYENIEIDSGYILHSYRIDLQILARGLEILSHQIPQPNKISYKIEHLNSNILISIDENIYPLTRDTKENNINAIKLHYEKIKLDFNELENEIEDLNDQQMMTKILFTITSYFNWKSRYHTRHKLGK